MTDVLVFLPGIMGSELHDAEGRVWPGTLIDGVFKFSDKRFERLLADDLEPRDIIREVGGVVKVYEPWIEALESMRSRETGAALFSEAAKSLRVVPYDWRKSASLAAERLAVAVDEVRQSHGADAQIHIAAHSLGGVIARYYLQSARFEQRPGFKHVRSFITFGTPHNGSPIAVAGAIGQHQAQFLDSKQTKTIVNDERFPALYELFPDPSIAIVWDRTTKGRLQPLSIYDPAFGQAKLGLNAKNLQRALDLHNAIRGKKWPDVRTFIFVGTRFETITHFYWNGTRAQRVDTEDAGDGAVPLTCSMVPGQQMRFTSREHGAILLSKEARDGLGELFGADGLLFTDPNTIVIVAPRDQVVSHNEPIHILLRVEGPATSIGGTLFLERARIAATAETIGEAAFDVMNRQAARALSYGGPNLAALTAVLDGVTGPGVYRPVFETDEAVPRRFYGPALIVRSP